MRSGDGFIAAIAVVGALILAFAILVIGGCG